MVNENTNHLLTLIPNVDEIKNVILSLKKDSAMGPDDFEGYFYHTFWHIIKYNVIKVVS